MQDAAFCAAQAGWSPWTHRERRRGQTRARSDPAHSAAWGGGGRGWRPHVWKEDARPHPLARVWRGRAPRAALAPARAPAAKRRGAPHPAGLRPRGRRARSQLASADGATASNRCALPRPQASGPAPLRRGPQPAAPPTTKRTRSNRGQPSRKARMQRAYSAAGPRRARHAIAPSPRSRASSSSASPSSPRSTSSV
jgi:hypothetical protein